MRKTELNNIEYISGIFKGLSAERKDYLLDTARLLSEIQDRNLYPVKNRTVSRSRKDDCLMETSSAYAEEKIKELKV